MAKSKSFDLGVLIAIIFATAAISGSLVFFGMQVAGSNTNTLDDINLQAEIEKGIDAYVQKQVDEQQAEVKRQQQASLDNLIPVSGDDHIFGDPNAPVSIIEYSDFDCPYCALFHPTAKQVVEESNGQVNWVYRHFPLRSHDPSATAKAVASECVAELGGNNAFWEFTDLMFEDKPDYATETLAQYATQVGVDSSAFIQCIESEKYAALPAEQLQEGAAAGVTGTPGNFIVNNQTDAAQLAAGALPIERLQPIIDEIAQSE